MEVPGRTVLGDRYAGLSSSILQLASLLRLGANLGLFHQQQDKNEHVQVLS